MTIATPLSLRWERAQQIDRSAIEPLGLGWYVVPSSRDPTGYAVHVEFNPDGELTAATCTCPDFEKPAAGQGTPTLHELRVCKHVLAASLKARDGRLPASDSGPACNAQTEPGNGQVLEPSLVAVEPATQTCEPVWDQECEEWVLTDAEGIHHCGASPSACRRQYYEATHYRAEHTRKNGHPPTAVSESAAEPITLTADEPPDSADQMAGPRSEPDERQRRQALSRARGIANQARPARVAGYRLYGIMAGDVLDWSDRGMFLAVESVTYESLYAQGVLQDDPWGAVRDIRMVAEMVHVRLQNGWLTKVRRPPCR